MACGDITWVGLQRYIVSNKTGKKFHMLLYLYTVRREVEAKENLCLFINLLLSVVLWFFCNVQVLMALERIEQDEELTHEVLVLGLIK